MSDLHQILPHFYHHTMGQKIILFLFIDLHQHPIFCWAGERQNALQLPEGKNANENQPKQRGSFLSENGTFVVVFAAPFELHPETERGVKFRVLPVRRSLSPWKFVAAHPDNICSLSPTCAPGSCCRRLTSCLGQLSLRIVSDLAACRTRSCRSPLSIYLDLGSLWIRLKFDCWKWMRRRSRRKEQIVNSSWAL